MSATNRGSKRIDQDAYQTPQWCVHALAVRLPLTPLVSAQGLIVIDAGAGDGRIGLTAMTYLSNPHNHLYCIERDPKWEAFRKGVEADGHGHYVRQDFLEWLQKWDNRDGRSVLIVGNPPFSQSEDFVMRSVAWMRLHGTMAVFLLRLNWLASKRRAEWLNANPPSRITALAPRPSFCKTTRIVDGKKKTSGNDSCEYAWVWWTAAGTPMDPHFEVAQRVEGV